MWLGDDDDADDLAEPSREFRVLPPEDRSWRHPSELGQARYREASTPGLGGGLVAAIGLVGVAVAVGVLWLMQGSLGSTSPVDERTARVSSGRGASSGATVSTVARWWSGRAAELPRASLIEGPVDESDGSVLTPGRSIAVDSAVGRLVVVPLYSVDGQESVTVRLPSGEVISASVLLADADLSIAVVGLPDLESIAPIAVGEVPAAGSLVTLMGDRALTVTIESDDQRPRLSGAPRCSGSFLLAPVIDSQGWLVGWCADLDLDGEPSLIAATPLLRRVVTAVHR